ncbi:exodeoxyribonuclease V subunit gamma [Thalassolituus sp. LLYu03]|uniref:exodeoxyribonuclease V subunit gamma n=1 Tax=Thalassolituus sp. LLYu03 TaxID=3421656 RepID=UPI003D268D77
MFRLYHANDLEILKGILLKLMQQSPAGPFAKEAILVQSQGMSHWLKLQLADGLGVAAQVDFPLPSSFVWQVFNRLKPDLPERSHFDKHIMAWKLVRLLPELAAKPECAAIAHYLTDDQDGLRCYQLATTIADVFDQYLVYRPDWLLSWEMGVDEVADTDVSAHAWQPYVWRALVADSAELNHSLDHRARLLTQLEDLVAKHPERLQGLPKRLFVFGIAALPGSYWQVLKAISPVIDVHFFLLNPCRNFWGDIVSDKQRLSILRKQPDASDLLDRGNPLLASWGKLGRDFLTLVNDSSADGELQDVELWYQDDSKAPSLLNYVQRDILDLTDRQQGAFTADALLHSRFKQGIDASDGSLRLVSAHSPLREVQRLYDQILFWLEHNPQLKPRDIVVMVPDIDQYAPYIDAVFASHKATTSGGGEYRIPWAIADQSMAQEDPLIDSFLRLLGLADSRLLITDVQDWLDVAAIRNRFDLSEDDLPPLRDWLAQAQIRWGLDGEQRRQLGLPAFEQNSWRKGLRQLLLGYMLPDGDDDFLGDFPLAAAEGNEGERLGKLMAFIDTLEHWQRFFAQGTRLNADWVSALQRLLPDFYAPSDSEHYSLQRLRDVIQRWSDELAIAAFDCPLTPVVVRSWFNEQLGQQGGWQRFLAGPVNFCTLMPMRSIPFKAVCLLGMNDEDYPRRVTPVGFDLMVSGKPRRGDRSRREDDRYLFLEAVCSAQDYLYISYRGRDVRENAELQPSVLVAELRDYLCDGFCLNEHLELPHSVSHQHFAHWLCEELPLQPYNPAHFSPQNNPRNIRGFQSVWAQVANAGLLSAGHGVTGHSAAEQASPWLTQALALPADLNQLQVLWSDVCQAMTDPMKFFMTRRLRATLDIHWQEHETEEPFAPGGLDFYLLKQEWLNRVMTNTGRLDDVEADALVFTGRQQALGLLPVNQLGRVWSEGVATDVLPLAHTLFALTQQRMPSRALSYRAGGCDISGELQQAFCEREGDDTGYLVLQRVGDIRGRDLLNAWLQLVLVAAAQPGLISHAVLLGLGKEKNQKVLRRIVLKAPAQALAQAQVAQALIWYWQCWCQPLPHLPDTLWMLLNGIGNITQKTDDPDEQQEALEKMLNEMAERESGELTSAYLQRCLPQFVSDDLLNNHQQWLDDYGTLMRALSEHIVNEDGEAN